MSFNRALLYTGHVWHQRLLPRKHNFRYPFWWLAIPLQEWDGQPKKMPFGLSWHPKNHGPRNGSPVLPWLIEKLQQNHLPEIGEIVLHTQPSLFGYVFNPVSFYFIYNPRSELIAVWVEVNNTFGEHHDYLLHHEGFKPIRSGDVFAQEKKFHVSPFYQVSGCYYFRFITPNNNQLTISIEYDCEADRKRAFYAVQSGESALLEKKHLPKLLWQYGWQTLLVWLRIHWQAMKLWHKKTPFYGKKGQIVSSVENS